VLSTSAHTTVSATLLCFLQRLARQLRSTLFPYTTLFRSIPVGMVATQPRHTVKVTDGARTSVEFALVADATLSGIVYLDADRDRSEEHTSELQSRVDLVCRLLLEKKK